MIHERYSFQQFVDWFAAYILNDALNVSIVSDASTQQYRR